MLIVSRPGRIPEQARAAFTAEAPTRPGVTARTLDPSETSRLDQRQVLFARGGARREVTVPAAALLAMADQHGFVEQDRDSDKYQLGAGLLQLGNSYLGLNELRSRSIAHAERLASRADAAVRVGVMHGPTVVIVHHVFRPDTTLQILEVGAELPLHASALGKAMLAYSSDQAIGDLLADSPPRLTSRTLGPAALRDQLIHIRERAFATEKDEAILGESSIASPIFDH